MNNIWAKKLQIIIQLIDFRFFFPLQTKTFLAKKHRKCNNSWTFLSLCFHHLFLTIFPYCTSGYIGAHLKKSMKRFKHFLHLFDEYAYFTIDFDAHIVYYHLDVYEAVELTRTWKSISYPIRNEFDHLFW